MSFPTSPPLLYDQQSTLINSDGRSPRVKSYEKHKGLYIILWNLYTLEHNLNQTIIARQENIPIAGRIREYLIYTLVASERRGARKKKKIPTIRDSFAQHTSIATRHRTSLHRLIAGRSRRRPASFERIFHEYIIFEGEKASCL